ncbi:hypothetical protein J6G99_04125 [bacterium]|nr:hypothetical protein [bacterium]
MSDLAIQSNQKSKGLDALYNNYFKKPLKQVTTSFRNGNFNLNLNNFNEAKKAAASAAGVSQYGAFTAE